MTYTVNEKLLAFCVDDGFEDYVTETGPGFYIECLRLIDAEIIDEYGMKSHRYIVSYDVNKGDIGGHVPHLWEHATEDFTEAYNMFKDHAFRGAKIFLCDRFDLDYGWLYDDGTPGYRSSSSGDYGPGNPWDAPGMKVSDFLPGVY